MFTWHWQSYSERDSSCVIAPTTPNTFSLASSFQTLGIPGNLAKVRRAGGGGWSGKESVK